MTILTIKNTKQFNDIILNTNNFHKKKFVIVDFFADWCRPCKQFMPIYEELSNIYEQILFTKVNIEDNQKLAEIYNIGSLPTFIIYKTGYIDNYDKIIGANKKKLEEKFILLGNKKSITNDSNIIFNKVTLIKTIEDFKQIITHNNKKYIIVDFYATWCKPCIKFMPIYEKLSDKYNDICFVKVNIEEAEELALYYNIRSLPTFMIFNYGNLNSPYKSIVGTSEKDIINRLNSLSFNNNFIINDDF